jgi:hypothetical protein
MVPAAASVTPRGQREAEQRRGVKVSTVESGDRLEHLLLVLVVVQVQLQHHLLHHDERR